MPDPYSKVPKSEMELAYEDARDLTRARIRQVVRRVTDLAYVEIDEEFRRALLAGEEISVAPDVDAIMAKVFEVAEKQLTA